MADTYSTSADISDADIEAVARVLATQEGGPYAGPDDLVMEERFRRVSQYGLVVVTGIEARAQPLWHFYRPQAKAVLTHQRQKID